MTLKCYHRDTSTAEQNVQTNLSRQEYSNLRPGEFKDLNDQKWIQFLGRYYPAIIDRKG